MIKEKNDEVLAFINFFHDFMEEEQLTKKEATKEVEAIKALAEFVELSEED